MRVPWMLRCTVLLMAVLGVPGLAMGQGLKVFGYADFEAYLAGVGSDDSQLYFDNHHFNLKTAGSLVDNLFVAAEIEYEHAGEEIAFEYGFLSYTGLKNVTISAGKFIVPFGRFNKDLHPTWINKMPDRPHGFSNILPQTYSDVGLWVTGALPLGESGGRVTLDAFVVNGLLGDDGGNIRDMRDNDRERLSAGGRDDNKAFGGRLGLEMAPQGFDIGASAYIGNYLDDPANNLSLKMFGVDAAFMQGGLEVRAEGVLASQEATGGNLSKKGGYAQVAYVIQGRFEPVVRFSLRDMPTDAQDQNRISVGINYYVSANSSVRLAFHLNNEKDGFKTDNNNLVTQFNVAF
ncbi:MAG TPA: porin [Gemmatimonadales bacterium]